MWEFKYCVCVCVCVCAHAPKSVPTPKHRTMEAFNTGKFSSYNMLLKYQS